MYLTGIFISNIRSIKSLVWKIEAHEAPGWHVMIGDNGSGKSSILRSIAMALIGESGAEALQQNWNTYLRYKTKNGEIKVYLLRDKTYDQFVGGGFGPAQSQWTASIGLTQEENHEVRLKNLLVDGTGDARDLHDKNWQQKSGWFSASYGLFRRFTGGDREEERLRDAKPNIGRHLSLFRENLALTESLRWLESLQFKKLEEDAEGALLDGIKLFVNQTGFLPNDTRLHQVSSRGVQFVDGNRNNVLIEDLSDGYRSMLSMTLDLIRQLALTYGPHKVFKQNEMIGARFICQELSLLMRLMYISTQHGNGMLVYGSVSISPRCSS